MQNFGCIICGKDFDSYWRKGRQRPMTCSAKCHYISLGYQMREMWKARRSLNG